MASAAVGGALLAVGIGRRSLGGAATALAGGWLCYRGLVGTSPVDRMRNGSADVSDGRHDSEDAPDEVPDSTETERSVTVGKPADEVYGMWRDPETMTRTFGGPITVVAPDEERWHWTVSGPLGWSVTWDTRVDEDRPGEFLRWTSTEDAAVTSEGSVRFGPAPDDRGTEVTFRFRFDPPGGVLGEAATKRLGIVPDALAGEALRRFKNLAETGEISTLEKNPSARGTGDVL